MNYLTRSRRRSPQRPPARSGRGSAARSAAQSVAVAARETCALILDEDSEAVESDQDVSDLVLRLRGHLMQLGPIIDAVSAPAAPLRASLDEAREMAWTEVSGDFMESRVHLRRFAQVTHAVLVEMGRIGLVCMHRKECPPATAPDRSAAQVRLRYPEVGCSLLCNGVLSFTDCGALGPGGEIYPPRRLQPNSPAEPATSRRRGAVAAVARVVGGA
ncbi:DUF5999 family protein [Streptomyces sp. NPDC020800]|uniref:DUF5999 family protein n=1 Tax=Streptomyces sp. NPDC020800 TaxID=3365092 RepID=UPI0037B61128